MKVENFPIYRKIFRFFRFIGKFSTRANILIFFVPILKKLVKWKFFRFELEKFPPSPFQQFLRFSGVGAGAGAGAGVGVGVGAGAGAGAGAAAGARASFFRFFFTSA